MSKDYKKHQSNSPVAVIAGDIHYNLNTMHVADQAVRQAINLANKLNVPFISNGDMLDTKANLRAEYVNMIIKTFKTTKIKSYVNVGNHSRINERSKEHALNFLKPYANIVEIPTFIKELDSYIIPYDHDPKELKKYLKTLPKNSRLIMHQGVNKALPGEYILDKSAIDAQDLADFRTILSHYHARQDIECGNNIKNKVGLASYIGNPYTLNFAEANDPKKGFQILMDDGSLEFVPTNLRKHVVIDFKIDDIDYINKIPNFNQQDLIWVKLQGTKKQLDIYTKKIVAKTFQITQDFKLDLIPTDTKTQSPEQQLTNDVLLDNLIDSLTNTTNEQKTRLKEYWKQL